MLDAKRRWHPDRTRCQEDLLPRISRGVTLIEVTLAMLLGSFLMLAVFQSFYVSARYRHVASEAHTLGLSLTNCFRDITSDLTGHAMKLTRNNNLGSKHNHEELISSFSPKLAFQDSFAGNTRLNWVSFVGEPNYCAFQTSTSNPRFNLLPNGAVQTGNSLVVWWLYRGGAQKVEAWVSSDLRVAHELKIPSNAKGLIRTQICRDQQGNEVQLSQVINPDISEIGFRYTDGTSIQTHWDSTVNQKSPRAVAVHVKIMNRETDHWIAIPTTERN